MSTSVRSYLVAGAAAATATAIALAPVQAAPADIAVPAQPTSTQPQLTQAMVDLLAAASRMTAAVAPRIASQTGDAPAAGVAPAAAVTGDVAVQNAASDWLTAGYEFIQYWVDYGVELADWVLGWIPGGWIIGDQINIFYGSLIRPVADAIFYQAVVPIVNDPLNLNTWWNSGVAIANATINGLISLGLNEAEYFLGWILPPLPPIPNPPWPFSTLATTQTLAASQSLFPNLRNAVGDVVLPPADFVTDAAVSTIDGAAGLVNGATNFVVDGAEDAFDALNLHFISRQIQINQDLVNALSAQGVGLTTDLIQVPDRYLNDVLKDGQGLLEALGTEARFVGNSFADHGSNAVNAVGDYVNDQINYFTPGRAAVTTKEVTDVPTSVRATLQAPVDSVKDEAPAPTSTVTNRVAKSPAVANTKTDVSERVQARVKDTVGAAKKTADETREAIRAAVKNATPKPKVKKEKAVSAKDSQQSNSQQSKDSGDAGKSDKAKN